MEEFGTVCIYLTRWGGGERERERGVGGGLIDNLLTGREKCVKKDENREIIDERITITVQ